MAKPSLLAHRIFYVYTNHLYNPMGLLICIDLCMYIHGETMYRSHHARLLPVYAAVSASTSGFDAHGRRLLC